MCHIVYADWCGPCKAIAPVYEKLASQLSRPNHITFTKVNGDQQTELAKAYSVRAYVTFRGFQLPWITYERTSGTCTMNGSC